MEQELGLRRAVRRVYAKFATFSGRARREEFWWFCLFTLLAGIVLSILDGIVFGTGRYGPCNTMGLWGGHMDFAPGGTAWCARSDGGPLTNLFGLINIIPSLALWSRRLHDTDRSFWWLLLVLIPVIGWIILFVFAVSRGTIGDNRFGPDPVTTPDKTDPQAG